MAKVKINLDEAEAPPVVTPGPYILKITSGEQLTAKETDTEMIKWQLEVQDDGKFKGRKINHITTIIIDPIKDPTGEKTKFSQYMLRVFLEACKFKWDKDGFEPNDVVNSLVVGEVGIHTYEGRESNNVGRFWPTKPGATAAAAKAS